MTSDAEEPKVMTLKEGTLEINLEALEEIFGSTNRAFIEGISTQLVNVVAKGKSPNDLALSFAASMIAGMKPRDEIEAMLALQMVAIHNATTTFARRLAHVETIPQQDSAEKALNKLARTFTMQMQALQKYRSGGKQRVEVRHLHVNEGGQAIVGNVETGGRV